MRRNLVNDLIFKQSNEHMIDIVDQFKLGRTSIRTQLELGIMLTVKLEWFSTMLLKLKNILKDSLLDE